MNRDYLDFDLAISIAGEGYVARVTSSPAGQVSEPFTLPLSAVELAQFMLAVGPPRVSSRRLVPMEARAVDVKENGQRLGDALFSGEVARAFRESLTAATTQGQDLRVRLSLGEVPALDPVPWEYLYDSRLDRFLTLSQETPIVRFIDALERPPVVEVQPPLRVLVMISSPSDMPQLAVEREKQLLRATTGDLVESGHLQLLLLEDATLTRLQRALLDDYHVFHFIGHGGFDQQAQKGVLVLENEDGTGHRVSGAQLGMLLHDARDMQLAVLNSCEGARTSGRDALSGVGQALVRRGVPAVVAMQTEISDRAALVFSHEFYWFLTRGLGIESAICEVRKAMAVSDEASEWGTAVLLRSASEQPFAFAATGPATPTETGSREAHLGSLYAAAQDRIAAGDTSTARPMLEHIAAERPDYKDVTQLLERVPPRGSDDATGAPPPGPVPRPRQVPAEGRQPNGGAAEPGGLPPRGRDDYVGGQETDASGPAQTTPRRRTVAMGVGAGLFALAVGAGIGTWQSRARGPTGEPTNLPQPSRTPSASRTTTAAPTSYVKMYDSSGWATYRSIGPPLRLSEASVGKPFSRVFQGSSSAGSPQGNQSGLWVFPDILADVGAGTITKVEAYIYFSHWFHDAGGTAFLTTHGYGGASGDNWPTSHPPSMSASVPSPSWPKPGGRWVELPNTHGTAYNGASSWRSGGIKGFGIGPAISTDTKYYGYAKAAARLRVSYQK